MILAGFVGTSTLFLMVVNLEFMHLVPEEASFGMAYCMQTPSALGYSQNFPLRVVIAAPFLALKRALSHHMIVTLGPNCLREIMPHISICGSLMSP